MATIQIDRLLETVVRQNASDLHLAVGRPPCLRLRGGIRELQTKALEPEDTTALMKSITPERIQQEFEESGSGDFGFAYGDQARFRVSVFKQKGMASLVLRRIPNNIMTFEQIGLPKMAEMIWLSDARHLFGDRSHGLGQTTTLATMINYINENFERHIITMEDPIEYYHQHKKSIVVQREIGVDVPSFPEALRRALRQDPDVMLVGEMRDLDTIQSAITCAETGHLVFGTLHTSGAASTINRIIDAFPTDQQEQVRVQLSGNLIAVLSQTLCPRVDQEGMLAAYEFMYVTPGIQNLIRENKSFRIDSEIQTGKRYGMQLLDDNLWMHFTAGRISKEEAIDKSKNPGYMIEKMQKMGEDVQSADEQLIEQINQGQNPDEGEAGSAAKNKPPAPGGAGGAAGGSAEAERQAQITANRARLSRLGK